MSTSSPSLADARRLLQAEQRAEQQALAVLRGTTFTECLKLHGLAPTHEVSTPKGKPITLRGSDIYDQRTWKQFLASRNPPEPVCQLTDQGTRIAQQYQTWLLSEHTARYRLLSSQEDLAWFGRVVTLAVTRHIMEHQYEAYSRQGVETFADPQVAIEVGNLLLLHHLVKETARLVHHVVKEPTQARALIELFYQEHERQMQARFLLRHEPALTEQTTAGSGLTQEQEGG